MSATLDGKAFRLATGGQPHTDDSLWFPRNFEVIEVVGLFVHVKNSIESYWVSRTRFADALGRRVFIAAD